MIDYDMYEQYLGIKGKNLSEVRKHDSAMIMNATFTGSVGYKRVYVLDPEQGWIWTDAKYSRHSRQSIAADSVDYYLQFRPFEHYPVGTYVFVPDDTSDEIGFVEDMPVYPHYFLPEWWNQTLVVLKMHQYQIQHHFVLWF